MKNEPTVSRPVRIVVIGAGNRANKYLEYARRYPDRLQPVAVVDVNDLRRHAFARDFGLPACRSYAHYDDFFADGVEADMVLISTPENVHFDPAVKAIDAGYHILLEKPIAQHLEECREIARRARERGVMVGVCHVLRYHPYFAKIREIVASGELGQVVSVNHTASVGLDRATHSYVRGIFRRERESNPILLAKCCHDMDLIMWLKSGVAPRQVASFGSDFQFDPAKKPAGAGKRCLVDCGIEENCLYSAKKHYIDHPDRWSFYVWDCLEHLEKPTIEDKIQSLKTDNIHGRCVWDCEHTVVDHQSVAINFADGATATLNMIGGTAKAERNLHIIGTKGEIKGVFDDSVFTVRTIDTASESGWREEVVDLAIGGDKSGMTGSHGGGDLRLVEDFVRVLQGEQPSISCTNINDSLNGHLAVFQAEKARKTGTVCTMPQI